MSFFAKMCNPDEMWDQEKCDRVSVWLIRVFTILMIISAYLGW